MAASISDWSRFLDEDGPVPAPLFGGGGGGGQREKIGDATKFDKIINATLAEGGENALFPTCELFFLAGAVPLSLSADLAALATAAAGASVCASAALAAQASLLWEAGGYGLEVLAALLSTKEGRAAVLKIWARASLADLPAPHLRLLRRTLCCAYIEEEQLASLAYRVYNSANLSWRGDNMLWNKFAGNVDGRRAFARAEELCGCCCSIMYVGKEGLSPGGGTTTTCTPSGGGTNDGSDSPPAFPSTPSWPSGSGGTNDGSDSPPPAFPSTPSWPSSPATVLLLMETTVAAAADVVYSEEEVFLLPPPALAN